MVAVMSWEQACARRLARHGLVTPLPSIAAATAAMCGAHAQVMSAAELSIGLRVDAVTRSDVATALWDERSIVKTFGPRGTVHLLPAAELPTWTAALAAVPSSASMPATIRLDRAQTDAVVAAVDAALAGAELTLEELDAAVQNDCGSWAGELVMPAFNGLWPRWRQAIGTAARQGALCFGPNRGRRVTYTGPRRWLPGFRPADPPTALARLVHGYLHAYGPATPAHLAQWLATSKPWIAKLFDELPLDEVQLEGEPAWVNAGDTEPAGDAQPAGDISGVRLLPYFDAFAVGSHPRRLLYPGRAADRALAGSQAGNFPVLLVDGVVAGVWHHKRSGKKIAITVEPFKRLAATRRRALEAEVERIAMILQGRPELTIATITVGAHA